MARPLEVTRDEAGLYLPALDLHLDPARAVRRAFVSHAHADHASTESVCGSREVYASRETAALLEARSREKVAGARVMAWDGDGAAMELTLGAEHGGGAARVTIAPAGHVLGAAQLVVDHPGGRLVYTGDYQSGAGCTHAAGAPVACDELVIESTFALPIFRFPDRAATRARIVAFCEETLGAGGLPVLLAYSLGKAQELVHALVAAGVPVVAHGAVYRVCQAYEALGVPLGLAEGKVTAYAERTKKEKGKLEGVLVAPPRARATPMIKKRSNAVVAYVSGWALLDAAVERHRAHRGFALSDHADHDDLVATARATGARRVVATLGADAAVLARVLASRDVATSVIDVQALDERDPDEPEPPPPPPPPPPATTDEAAP